MITDKLKETLAETRNMLKGVGQTEIIILTLNRNVSEETGIVISGDATALAALALDGIRNIIQKLREEDEDAVNTVIINMTRLVMEDYEFDTTNFTPKGCGNGQCGRA